MEGELKLTDLKKANAHISHRCWNKQVLKWNFKSFKNINDENIINTRSICDSISFQMG